MSENDHYSFITEYWDVHAGSKRFYLLCFYPHDNSIEMHDMKTKRTFLKRIKYLQISLNELFVGASVSIFSRALKIVDLADEVTRKQFSKNEEMLIFIHGKIFSQTGNIIDTVQKKGMRIIDLRMGDAEGPILEVGVHDRFIAVHLGGANVEQEAEQLKGQYDGIIAIIQRDDVYNLKNFIFNKLKTTATFKNCAVCVIKPHAIGSCQGGSIIQHLLNEGFIITALGAFTMSMADTEDFFEIYKDVVPEYKRLVEHLGRTMVWAIELRGENIVEELRKVCGPHDPEVCHILFPHTLRAQFGKDRALNAVHCTDLREDGPLESQFFFQLMLNKDKK